MTYKKKKGCKSTESLTVRISPKQKFGLELLKRKQRRNITDIIAWTIEKIFKDPEEGLIERNRELEEVNLLDLLWDIDEIERIKKIATYRPNFLLYDEEVKLAKHHNSLLLPSQKD